MSPEDRNAVICSGGGAIGGAVARAFARKGARVFLAGCAPTKREAAAQETRPVGGVCERGGLLHWIAYPQDRAGHRGP